MTTLNLIGAGRVGRTLATLWARHGVFEIQDVLTSSMASAQAACSAMGAGTAVATLQAMRPADVWMVAVQDAKAPAAKAAGSKPAVKAAAKKPVAKAKTPAKTAAKKKAAPAKPAAKKAAVDKKVAANSPAKTN